MELRQLLESRSLAEEFVRLRGDLASLQPAPRHIVVLGPVGGEGVTSVATRLAVALSTTLSPGRVLLAEGNTYQPSLAQALGLGASTGLLDWDQTSALPVQPFPGVDALSIMVAGQAKAKSTGPDWGTHLSAAARRARTDFDHVVWDAPAATRWADGLTLAAESDGVVVVIEMDATRTDSLSFLRAALDRNRTPILGSVLNRTGRYWPRSARPQPDIRTA